MDKHGELVDTITREIGPAVSRARVAEVASEVAAQFENARITVYVPVFLRRMIRARLQEEIRRAVA